MAARESRATIPAKSTIGTARSLCDRVIHTRLRSALPDPALGSRVAEGRCIIAESLDSAELRESQETVIDRSASPGAAASVVAAPVGATPGTATPDASIPDAATPDEATPDAATQTAEIRAVLQARLQHPSALVREHVAWALARHEKIAT